MATSSSKQGLDSLGDALIAVASFLPKTSAALLAVAITAPSSSFREKNWETLSLRSSTNDIISSVSASRSYASLLSALCEENDGDSQRPDLKMDIPYDSAVFKDGLYQQLNDYYESKWEVLDFADIEKSLAVRLSDDDVGAVLVCIDAKSNLKHLKLTNLYGITGHGLEPLKSSSTLEKADLGLSHQFESPIFSSKLFNLSKEVVLPILRDILANSKYSFSPNLWRVNVPFSWRITSLLLPDEKWPRPLFNRNSMCFYFGIDDYEDYISLLCYSNKSDLTDTCFMCGSGFKFYCYNDCCDCGNIVCTCHYEVSDTLLQCKGAGHHHCQATTCMNCYYEKEDTYVTQCECCLQVFCKECREYSINSNRNNCKGCKYAVTGEDSDSENSVM